MSPTAIHYPTVDDLPAICGMRLRLEPRLAWSTLRRRFRLSVDMIKSVTRFGSVLALIVCGRDVGVGHMTARHERCSEVARTTEVAPPLRNFKRNLNFDNISTTEIRIPVTKPISMRESCRIR